MTYNISVGSRKKHDLRSKIQKIDPMVGFSMTRPTMRLGMSIVREIKFKGEEI